MTLLVFFLKVIVGSGILFGYYRLFLRNKRFHHYNRFYLLLSLALPPVLALINIPVFSQPGNRASEVLIQTLGAIKPGAINIDTAHPATGSGQWLPVTWVSFSIVVYGLVSLLLLIILLRGLKYIQQLKRRFPFNPVNELKVYHTNEPGTPFSFFQSIFWNEDIKMDSREGEQIFRHELFHVQQKHSADILFAELMSVIFWINPFAHLIRRELRAIHEFLADQYAIRNNDGHEYAALLITRILQTQSLAGTHYFFQTHIKRRIAMITQLKNKKYGYASRVMALPLAVLLFCGIALYARDNPGQKKTFNASNDLKLSLTHETPSPSNVRDTVPVEEKRKLESAMKALEVRKQKLIEQQAKQLALIEEEQRKLHEKLGLQLKEKELVNLKLGEVLVNQDKLEQELQLKVLLQEKEMGKQGDLEKEHLLEKMKVESLAADLHLQKLKLLQPNAGLTEKQKVLLEKQEQLLHLQLEKARVLDKESQVLMGKLKEQEHLELKNIAGVQAKEHELRALQLLKEDMILKEKRPMGVQLQKGYASDSLIMKLQRYFHRNLRYPADVLAMEKGGAVYVSIDLNEKEEVKDYVIHSGMPNTDGQPLYEIVVVGYASKQKTDTKGADIQALLNAEVERVIRAYKPAPGSSQSRRLYFKIAYHFEKQD